MPPGKEITREKLRAYLYSNGNCSPSTDSTLHYSPIADRDRFQEISCYLHFVDNTTLPERGSPGYDRLGKVRPVIVHLSERFTKLYESHREVAVDEAMIKFISCSSVKQYMPMKPIKRGIKVYGTMSNVYTQVVHTHGQTYAKQYIL